jgi:hypothetical protein
MKPLMKSFRVTLELSNPLARLDSILLDELRKQDRNVTLKRITRSQFKNLFKEKRITIKGQNAKPSSALARGKTDIDILGFEEDEADGDKLAFPIKST